MTDENEKPIANAHALIERFGGIRPMASKMNVPVTTVQGWKERGLIPGNRRGDIFSAAAANGITVSDIIDAEPDFEAIMKNAAKRDASATRHEQAVEAGRITALQDELAAKTKNAERRAVQKGAFVSVILVLAAATLCAFLFWAELRDLRTQGARLREAEKTIADLRAQIETLRDRPQPEDVRPQLEALSLRLEQISSAQPEASDLSPLENRIVELEKKAALQNEQIHAAQADVPPPAAPVLPASTLAHDLDLLQARIDAQAEPADKREKALSMLGDYLKVRKDGQLLTGSSTDAAFDQARTALERGDIDGAIAALETLPASARPLAQEWIDRALAQSSAHPIPAPALPPAAVKEAP